VTLVAKTMKEVALRYDTHRNEIAQSPTTAVSMQSNSDNNLFVEPPVRKSTISSSAMPAGDLFEISAEFDLHSVIAQTYQSMRPVRPKQIIRKYK